MRKKSFYKFCYLFFTGSKFNNIQDSCIGKSLLGGFMPLSSISLLFYLCNIWYIFGA